MVLSDTQKEVFILLDWKKCWQCKPTIDLFISRSYGILAYALFGVRIMIPNVLERISKHRLHSQRWQMMATFWTKQRVKYNIFGGHYAWWIQWGWTSLRNTRHGIRWGSQEPTQPQWKYTLLPVSPLLFADLQATAPRQEIGRRPQNCDWQLRVFGVRIAECRAHILVQWECTWTQVVLCETCDMYSKWVTDSSGLVLLFLTFHHTWFTTVSWWNRPSTVSIFLSYFFMAWSFHKMVL